MSLELAKSFLIDSRMCDRSQYTDDYSTTFPDGQAIPVDVVHPMMQAFIAAAPDLSFNCESWAEKGDKVTAVVRVGGTMTGAMSHPMFGDIPATGRKGQVAAESIELSFRDGKVASMVVVSAEGPSGPPELMRQWTA